MSDERPDALLKSALEKIVYFEARSEQLSNDLRSARAEAERLKAELASAAQREIELRRELAGHEVQVSRSHREREELARMNDALRSERATLIGKLIEASRIHTSGDTTADEDAHFDLASFIAELRGEAMRVVGIPIAAVQAHEAKRAAQAQAHAPQPALAVAAAKPSAVTIHAERLRAEGRLHVSANDVMALSGQFQGKTEETLFGFSVRELSSPDVAARIRAAERLKSLRQPASAPALASALNGEHEPAAQIALLEAFVAVAQKEGAEIVSPFLESSDAGVRVAALKGLLALDAPRAGPHLSAAMKDPDRAVRRRASLLALGLDGPAALELGQQAIRDDDAEVRSLAALVLGASGGERARALLVTALRDQDAKVRKAAAQSLSRIVGEDVSVVAMLEDAQRRREIRRISSLPVKPVSSAMPQPLDFARGERKAAPAPALPERTRGAPPALLELLAGELRISIRGRTVADLASLLRQPPDAVAQACEQLEASGRAVRRGQKYFAA